MRRVPLREALDEYRRYVAEMHVQDDPRTDEEVRELVEQVTARVLAESKVRRDKEGES